MNEELLETYYEHDDAPLSDYSTADILHDYRMLIEDFGPDDNLVKEMQDILISRHRRLDNAEMADLPQFWENSPVDTSQYYVSATLIFEVDKFMYNAWKNAGCLVRKTTEPTRHYVGFDILTKEGLPPEIRRQASMNILRHFMEAIK